MALKMFLSAMSVFAFLGTASCFGGEGGLGALAALGGGAGGFGGATGAFGSPSGGFGSTTGGFGGTSGLGSFGTLAALGGEGAGGLLRFQLLSQPGFQQQLLQCRLLNRIIPFEM